MPRNLENNTGPNRPEKVSLYNYMKGVLTNSLNLHPSKIMLKIIQHQLKSYMEKEMPDDIGLIAHNQ